jgi:hypothetical protein
MKGSRQVSLLHLMETSQSEFNNTVDKVLQGHQYSYLKTDSDTDIDLIKEKED